MKRAYSVVLFIVSVCAFAFAENVKVLTYSNMKNPRVREYLADPSIGLLELQKQKDGALRLHIPKEKIPADAQIIEIVANFMCAKKGEVGYFVMPDGRMGTFRLDNGVVDQSSLIKARGIHRIYPYSVLPIFGMKTEGGTFVGVVKSLNLECSFAAEAKNGEYKIYPRFHIKDIGETPYEDIIIDYYSLGKDASYCDMAKKYRQLQLDSNVVKPLRDRIKNNQQLKYTAESIFVRVKHGQKFLNTQKDKMLEDQRGKEPPIRVEISFDRFMEIMKELKALGVDRAEFCSVGGTAGGFDGKFPDILPIPDEFGGEAKMREAVKLGQSLGYQMVCHFATTAMFQISKNWNENYICKLPCGDLLKGPLVAGGRAYRLCPRVYVDKFLKRDWQTFRSLGFKGTHHIDVISCIMPYKCFDKNHYLNTRESAEAMKQIAKHSQEVFGSFGSEGPFDWIASNLDFALYTYIPNVLRENEMVDRVVPLWQLVYHGIIISNPFYSTIDPTYSHKKDKLSDSMANYSFFKDTQTQILKMVEFGGRPVFYYIPYKNLKPIKTAYDIHEKLKYLQYEFMEDHREIINGVFITAYSDGSEIIVNYSQNDFIYKGLSVPANNFKLFKPKSSK